ICIFIALRAHSDQYSFPTRRSSDLLVLRAQRDLEPITDRLLLTGVLARAPPQPRDGIDARTSRLVVPALDRRATEARRLAGDRMTPRLRRKLGDLAVQLAACRRRREQAPHDREAQPCPGILAADRLETVASFDRIVHRHRSRP